MTSVKVREQTAALSVVKATKNRDAFIKALYDLRYGTMWGKGVLRGACVFSKCTPTVQYSTHYGVR